MKDLVVNIESKVNKIISLYNSLKKEKEEILGENTMLKSEVALRDDNIKRLEEKIKLLRITKSVYSPILLKLLKSNKKIKSELLLDRIS